MATLPLIEIVDDLYPRIHPFWANGTINAGALVFISEADGVSQTWNRTYVPIGVALQSVGDNQRVSVALPPTRVWLGASSTSGISAGKYVCPSTTAGMVVNASNSTAVGGICLVGLVQSFYPSDTSLVNVRLTCIPNNQSRP